MQIKLPYTEHSEELVNLCRKCAEEPQNEEIQSGIRKLVNVVSLHTSPFSMKYTHEAMLVRVYISGDQMRWSREELETPIQQGKSKTKSKDKESKGRAAKGMQEVFA